MGNTNIHQGEACDFLMTKISRSSAKLLIRVLIPCDK